MSMFSRKLRGIQAYRCIYGDTVELLTHSTDGMNGMVLKEDDFPKANRG